MGDDVIQDTLTLLKSSSFRARFHLRRKEQEIVHSKGLTVMAEHAREIIQKRLAHAEPVKDGKQTPMRGHPVFTAQHATATCCRSCLQKWHKIPKGRALSDEEITYIVHILIRWISREMGKTRLLH